MRELVPIDVAVSGMGLSSALGIGVDQCVAQLLRGPVSPKPWTISNLGDEFTAPVYAIPDDQSLDDPLRAVGLIEAVVKEAVAAATLTDAELRSLPLFIGSSAYSLDRDAIRADVGSAFSAIGVDPVVAHQQITLIVQRLIGSAGRSFAFQTACTSSANALMSAARMIQLGWYKHALVVGVEIANLATVAGFGSLQLIASELKPFDRNRQGIVLGEGIGAVVLSAVDRDDGAGLFIRGGGTNIDTYRVTMSNPDGVVTATLTQQVMQRAGISRSQIAGIKAHGTGSPMNDSSEAAVVRGVFDNPPPICALKSYLGHTLGACGVNELVLLGAALNAGVFPATPGFDEADPALGLEPTRMASAARDGHYLLNYFGFGGHNSVLLAEYRGAEQRGAETARWSTARDEVDMTARAFSGTMRCVAASHYFHRLGDAYPSIEARVNAVTRERYRRIDRFVQLALLGAAECVGGRPLASDCGLYLSFEAWGRFTATCWCRTPFIAICGFPCRSIL